MRSVFSTLESPTPWPARFPELVYQIPFVSLITQSSAQKEKGGWEFWLGIKKHRIKSKGLGVRRSGWAPGINSYLLLSLSFLIYKKRLMVVMTSARQPHSSVLGSMRLWKAKAFVTTKSDFANVQSRQHLMHPALCAGQCWGAQTDHQIAHRPGRSYFLHTSSEKH